MTSGIIWLSPYELLLEERGRSELCKDLATLSAVWASSNAHEQAEYETTFASSSRLTNEQILCFQISSNINT